MPKGAKKAAGRSSRQLVLHGPKTDFTLYEFAHAAPTEVKSSGRMKKAVANALVTEVKEITSKPTKSSDALAWYEKDLSDFDDSESEELTEQDKEGEVEDGATVAKQRRCKSGKGTVKEAQEADHGSVWPLDLWYLIGKFIYPEDIATFSRICHGSHVVTHSANFWCSLYKRFYVADTILPASMQPRAIDRVHGLVERVVRSLYYFYPPFQDRLRNLSPFENDPEAIIGAKCIVMWYKRVNKLWHFFFKFQKANRHECWLKSNQGRSRRRRNYLMEEDNINYNPWENTCVLQVVTNNFISVPVTMGQHLIHVSVSVGHGMRYHKLKLVFNSEFISSKNRKDTFLNGTTVVMDPVANIKVLEWWDPKYPR